MKHILDSEFRYRPSFDTDVRKTFEKVRRQQQVRDREQSEQSKSNPETKVKVLKLEQLKKASGTWRAASSQLAAIRKLRKK